MPIGWALQRHKQKQVLLFQDSIGWCKAGQYLEIFEIQLSLIPVMAQTKLFVAQTGTNEYVPVKPKFNKWGAVVPLPPSHLNFE